MEEAEYANRKGYSRHHPAEALYNDQDTEGALSLVRTLPYRGCAEVAAGVSLSLHPAGHLLGSASVLLDWGRGGSRRRLLVSGDVGKYDDPFMCDPRPPREAVDYLLVESTYGDRMHDDAELEARLAQLVGRALERGGVLLVPAFAVGRTQEMLFHLARMELAGTIPVLDVYVDSPMAVDATEIYARHSEDLNFDWSAELTALRTQRTHFVRETGASKALAAIRERAIILSASGMATGGRVLHHLAQRVVDARNTVLFAGFQVEGTRGRKLVDGAATIRMFGQDWPVRAAIDNLRSLSAHGDQADLLRWASSLASAPRATWVVHGERRASEALAVRLASELRHDACVPSLGDTVELT
jgi:metallo-beta-lactamase family protein